MAIAKGQQMLASDILGMNFMPIGTILMYDGTGWTDDVTIPGWYKCDGNNGTPNLVNKFIRGSTSAGATSGADSQSITLTTAHLPSHSHIFSGSSNVSTSTASLTGAWAGGGESDGKGMLASGIISLREGNSHLGYTGSGSDTNNYGFNIDASHSHTVSVTTSGTISATGSGNAVTVNTVPVYYAVIYIRKCFNR